MPEQLLFQEGDGGQGQDQGLVFEHAVHIQAWGGRGERGAQLGPAPPPPTETPQSSVGS